MSKTTSVARRKKCPYCKVEYRSATWLTPHKYRCSKQDARIIK